MKKTILAFVIGFLLGFSLLITASDFNIDEEGLYYTFDVVLPTAIINLFTATDHVVSAEIVGGGVEEAHRVHLNVSQENVGPYLEYLEGINQMAINNKAYSLEFPLAARMPVCYWDYGLERTVACYMFNKQLICVDDDGKCDY